MQNCNSFQSYFLIEGPVLIGAGIMTILCSLEICVRLHKETKRVQDPELDNLRNPHEVKHWMDPRIIPYGWGMFTEARTESPNCVMIPLLTTEKVKKLLIFFQTNLFFILKVT